MNKYLLLVLKAEWYNRWLVDKFEDYREIKPYWLTRLFDLYEFDGPYVKTDKPIKWDKDLLDIYSTDVYLLRAALSVGRIKPKPFGGITLQLGYSSITKNAKFLGIEVGFGKPELGADIEKPVFIIKGAAVDNR